MEGGGTGTREAKDMALNLFGSLLPPTPPSDHHDHCHIHHCQCHHHRCHHHQHFIIVLTLIIVISPSESSNSAATHVFSFVLGVRTAVSLSTLNAFCTASAGVAKNGGRPRNWFLQHFALRQGLCGRPVGVCQVWEDVWRFGAVEAVFPVSVEVVFAEYSYYYLYVFTCIIQISVVVFSLSRWNSISWRAAAVIL